ncbi:hypothetical protein HGRIS_010199 [Hohenbuehelia grisea]|uniref:Uncharacterized protein n=1 Tax=Hohenbuehelia grisea TaxID=104357 RepID=A0ABR3J3Y1_9AGAR
MVFHTPTSTPRSIFWSSSTTQPLGPETSPPAQANVRRLAVGGIVGAVLGSLLGVSLLTLLAYLLIRCKRRRDINKSADASMSENDSTLLISPAITAPPIREPPYVTEQVNQKPDMKSARRRMQLQDQAERIHRELAQMEAVTQQSGPRSDSTDSSWSEQAMVDTVELARQMNLMRAQIARLEVQQQSPWARGLTDEPPPGYEPVE